MKQAAGIALALIASLLLQTTVLGDVHPKPDGVIVVTLAVAFLRGPSWGLVTGFSGGLLEDGLSGISHGLFCLANVLVGLIFGWILKGLYPKNLLGLNLMAVSGVFAYVVLLRGFAVILGWMPSFHFPASLVSWLFAEGGLSLCVLFLFKKWLFPERYEL